ncbi:MAG: hypothetical protein MRERV_28c004 [Mycoplasmataceae bacterium RV_VA103A]|nr:MAG: hypothetical protein MRERV_28c004 [Mycoplasmataceae bacterium RV_VA103A]
MSKPASHYNNLRREISNKNVLGALTVLGTIILTGLGIVFMILKAGCSYAEESCQNAANKSYQYSQSKFAEAEVLRQQGQADKNQDNQEFNDGLARQNKEDLSESEVESDLEDSFVDIERVVA